MALVVISDEDDCSVQDRGFFDADELDSDQSPDESEVACGRHEDSLYSLMHYLERFREMKDDYFSTVFTAIVGVPPNAGLQEENPCEGDGDDIRSCLDRPEMQNKEILETDAQTDEQRWTYADACTREENGSIAVRAKPGRRYVELAQQFGFLGSVHSICNRDWQPAMAEIATFGISCISNGTICRDEAVQWDEENNPSNCELMARYEDITRCPIALDAGAEPIAQTEVIHDVAHDFLYCPLPRLDVSSDCEEAEQDPLMKTTGWYFCEDHRENFERACDPLGDWSGADEDRDEDGDGAADCADKSCWDCKVCDGEEGVDPLQATEECQSSCLQKIAVTRKLRYQFHGEQIFLYCPDKPGGSV